jgi:hypothetical protein
LVGFNDAATNFDGAIAVSPATATIDLGTNATLIDLGTIS